MTDMGFKLKTLRNTGDVVFISLIKSYGHTVVYNVFVLLNFKLNNNWLKDSVEIMLVCYLILS